MDPLRLRLTTARAVLHVPQPADARAVLDYHVRNRDHLAAWAPPRPPAFFTLLHWERRIPRWHAEARTGVAVWLAIRQRRAEGWPERPSSPGSRILGHLHLFQILRGPQQSCHLGYGLDREQVGQGLMSEAVREVVRFVFEDLRLKRVVANHDPDNLRSARLLARAGFAVEGRAREALYTVEGWRDLVVTALSNPDAARVAQPEELGGAEPPERERG
jgi:ribosomal-protein-alanine N-acetyltransferase